LNSWFLVGSLANLLQTPYGQLLLVKLGLFGGMLSLAALNRFWLVPALMKDQAAGQAKSALIRLHRLVIGEQLLGAAVVLIVSMLGTMEPAISSS
jgi:putative copper resistance protein D